MIIVAHHLSILVTTAHKSIGIGAALLASTMLTLHLTRKLFIPIKIQAVQAYINYLQFMHSIEPGVNSTRFLLNIVHLTLTMMSCIASVNELLLFKVRTFIALPNFHSSDEYSAVSTKQSLFTISLQPVI